MKDTLIEKLREFNPRIRRELFGNMEVFCSMQLEQRHINAKDEMFETYKFCKNEIKATYSLSNKEFNELRQYTLGHLKQAHVNEIERYFRNTFLR